MKVTFTTEELKKRLSQLAGVVSKKAAIPVYGYVRLFSVQQLQGFIVGFSGIDTAAALTVTLTKAKADGPVDVLLPFSKLIELVSGISASETTLDVDGETSATLKAGKFKAELKPHPLANWPNTPDRPETALATINLGGVQGQIQDVESYVPANDGKFVVSVAKLTANEQGIVVVATNGFGLAISRVEQNAGNFDLLVPKTAFDYIKKLDGGETLTVYESEGGFFFETALETLSISRSHGQFPNYAALLPKATATTLSLDKAAFVAALRRVRVLADAEAPAIIISGTENPTSILLEASSDESGSDGFSFKNNASDEVETAKDGAGNPVPGTGPAFKVVLNADVLLPFLERAYGSKTGVVTFGINDFKSIVEFSAHEGAFKYYQMPIPQKQ